VVRCKKYEAWIFIEWNFTTEVFWLQHVSQSKEDRFIYTSPKNDEVSEKDMHVHFTFSPGIGDHHRNNSFGKIVPLHEKKY